jgi:hypothetical protein
VKTNRTGPSLIRRIAGARRAICLIVRLYFN